MGFLNRWFGRKGDHRDSLSASDVSAHNFGPSTKEIRDRGLLIAVFANPEDTELVDWVRLAASRAGVGDNALLFIEVKQQGIRARGYGALIRRIAASIIDVRHKGLFGMSARLGSLAAEVERELHDEDWDGPWRSPLDSRILLVTRSSEEDEEVKHYFDDFYTRISIADGIDSNKGDQLALWIKETLATSLPKVFISHRSAQKKFAASVAQSLKERGAFVWFDEWDIMPGDSIPEAINRGLGWCTHLVLIVDDTFFESKWATAEVEAVLYRHLSGPRRKTWNDRSVIPLFLVDPDAESMPPLLSRIRGIDCRDSSTIPDAMQRLWIAITAVGPR